MPTDDWARRVSRILPLRNLVLFALQLRAVAELGQVPDVLASAVIHDSIHSKSAVERVNTKFVCYNNMSEIRPHIINHIVVMWESLGVMDLTCPTEPKTWSWARQSQGDESPGEPK